MKNKTFVEKIFDAKTGDIVFASPDIILTHDNTASIKKTFEKMGGVKVKNPDSLLVVLDHNAPPTNAALATQYQVIRDFVEEQGVGKFYDSGHGICHQLMANHAKPKMIIVGSDSHTCTAGAFNAFAAGIDRTEAAGLWKKGETWFRVPESVKITLNKELQEGVCAKDLSLYIIGMLSSSGANYMSIEYHGDGVKSLSISDRMTITNLASEMGAKNAVFPADKVLAEFYGLDEIDGVWADSDAEYIRKIEIDLSKIPPMIAVPHNVDNVFPLSEFIDTPINQGLIGTCTNGRLEDLREAAKVLKGQKVAKNFQLLIIPASKKIYQAAIKEGLVDIFFDSGANILSSSCGPCLGTGQGIPADGYKVIATSNRNFLGRQGNKKAEIYLASPAVVAKTAIYGKITDTRKITKKDLFLEKYKKDTSKKNIVEIKENDNRRVNSVWDYSDVDNINTDQMFAGNLTYNILSSDGKAIVPHLFEGFDKNFTKNAKKGDIIVAGENFGMGSSREHPAVGLSYIENKAVIVKSVNRIFYRSSINQGLTLIVNKEIVEKYKRGDALDIDLEKGIILLNNEKIKITPLPEKLLQIIEQKGLVNWMKKN